MTDNPSAGPLEPGLQQAIEIIRSESVPDDAVARVHRRALAVAKRTRSKRHLKRILAMAASIVLVALGITLLFKHGTTTAFAHMLEKVKEAKTVKLDQATRFGLGQQIKGSMVAEGNRVRFETLDGTLVEIFDLDARKCLALDTTRKIAQIFPPLEVNNVKLLANPIEQLRKVRAADAERLGQELIKGRLTTCYRVKNVEILGMKGMSEMLIWVDPDSELPVGILIRDTDPKNKLEVRLENITWNEPIAADKLALKIPEGFKEDTVIQKTPATVVSPELAVKAADGVLTIGRVAGSMVWDTKGKSLVVALRDAESVKPEQSHPHLLARVEIPSGKVHWSAAIAGADKVARSPDGKHLATVMGQEVQLRDIDTGKVFRTWQTNEPIYPLAFSPDGKTLAVGINQWGKFGGDGGSMRGGVLLWDTATGNRIGSWKEDLPTTLVAWLPDGNQIATASNDGPIRLRTPATGELVRIFPGRPGFSLNRITKSIAFPLYDPAADKTIGQVIVADQVTGKTVQTLRTDRGPAASHLLGVEYSPDGKLVAGYDWNSTVTLWDATTGKRLALPGQHKGGVVSAAFAPDGKLLATGSEDGTIRLWKVTEAKPTQENK